MLKLDIEGFTVTEAVHYIRLGLEHERDLLARKIAAATITGQPAKSAPQPGARRQVSDEARARISEAQQKRWKKVKLAEGRAKKAAAVEQAQVAGVEAPLAS